MKRLGIMADIKGVQENTKKLIIKCRHISPPPPVLTQGIDGGNDQQSNLQTIGDTTKTTCRDEYSTETGKPLFKFPFQRRARSLSLPKDENGNDQEVEEPKGDKPAKYESRQQQNFTIMGKQKSPSPPHDDKGTKSKPVVATDNFVLSHKNLIPGVKNLLKKQQDQEIMRGD